MARQPITQEQAADLIAKYLSDLVSIENSVARWRSAVFMAASMSKATCGMIKSYNTGAVQFWVLAKESLEEFHRASKGTPLESIMAKRLPPYPPEPTLLGYGITQQGGVKRVVLDCASDDEMPDPTKLRSFGTQPGWPCLSNEAGGGDGKTLRAAPAAAAAGICAAGPNAIGCLIAGTIVLAGLGVLYLVVSKVVEIFVDSNKINLQRAKLDYENNARVAEAYTTCVAKGGDPAACMEGAKKAFPRSGAPYARNFFLAALPVTLVVGTVLVVYFVTRGKKKDE